MTADAVGGVWTYCLDLANGLASAGLETTLVVLGPSPAPDQIVDAAAVPGLSLIDSGLPLDWTADGPAEVAQAARSVQALAADGGADLIHLNSPILAADGGFSAPVLGACHSCLATWWSAVKTEPMPADFRWRTRMLWRGLHACDVLTAPTRAFARETSLAYEILAPKVVLNGRPSRNQASFAAREPIVFTSGRLWDEGKNVAVLDRAAGLSRNLVYMAGQIAGPNGATIDLSHARSLGRLSSDEIAGWLARATIYASGARYEPFGLGVLEAARAGCSLVLSDIPSFRELWDGAAVFVDPDDASAYAAAFDQLLGDEAEQGRLAACARARSARYTVTRMTDGILEAYRSIFPGIGGTTTEAAVA